MNDFRYRREYRGRLQAVLLDWAGTTVDYGCRAPAAAFIEVFRRKGVEITMEEAREPMGAHKKVHIRKISQLPAVSRRWEEVHGSPCTEADVEAMFDDFVPLQIDCLGEYADLIPGTLEAVDAFRRRGLRIGSTTGYTREMMNLLLEEAAKRGYAPDASVCATEVPAGRPEPWMCFANARKLRVFPMEAIVKIGDTLPDIAEGLNAGAWTIGVAMTGNEIGLEEKEIGALPGETCERLRARAYERLYRSGAHYVVDAIADAMPCLEDIERRLARGERP